MYLLTIWVEGDLAHGPGLIEPTNNILNLNTFEYLSKTHAPSVHAWRAPHVPRTRLAAVRLAGAVGHARTPTRRRSRGAKSTRRSTRGTSHLSVVHVLWSPHG